MNWLLVRDNPSELKLEQTAVLGRLIPALSGLKAHAREERVRDMSRDLTALKQKEPLRKLIRH
jgi:hypothetical protein